MKMMKKKKQQKKKETIAKNPGGEMLHYLQSEQF
jgi:hypothetical protein